MFCLVLILHVFVWFDRPGQKAHSLSIVKVSSFLYAYLLSCWYINFQFFSVNFELEPGAVGHTTDFKETNKRLEWGIKKVILIFCFSINYQYILKHQCI